VTATVSTATDELIAAHEHLVPITVRRRYMSLLSPRYSFEDACQEGWIGLRHAALTHDPDVCTFQSHAINRIRKAVVRGAGRVEGIDSRRGRPRKVLSLDELVVAHAASDRQTLGARIPDPGPGPDTAALDRAGLTAAVDAARASVDDLIDLVVLDWLLNLDDTRTQVGSHEGPFWRDLTRGDSWQVCDRHRRQYETADDEYGPFEWVEVDA
jgi:hypothetical protein